jgi:hypothetical protein
MKKFFLKPGLEVIFSVSLIAILGLPPVLMAQNQKDVEIKIENGDTTVNGKNIRELSAADRKNALRDIRHIDGDNNQNVYFFKRKDTTGGKTERFEFRKRIQTNGDHQPMITGSSIIRDSVGNVVVLRRGRRRQADSNMTFSYRLDRTPGGPGFGNRPGGPMMMGERRNSQNFDYVNTDNEGISTHVRFHVSDVSNEDLKKMPHVEGGKFEITDLNLVPEFSTGKTLLMFDLPGKAPGDVKFIDSEGKVLWNDKSNGSGFSKTFVMGLNGIYYLQIKQGRNIAIKRIMKGE